jgi:hypothetical protein
VQGALAAIVGGFALVQALIGKDSKVQNVEVLSLLASAFVYHKGE